MGYNGRKADKVAEVNERLKKKVDEVNRLMEEIHSAGGLTKVNTQGFGGSHSEKITTYVSIRIS